MPYNIDSIEERYTVIDVMDENWRIQWKKIVVIGQNMIQLTANLCRLMSEKINTKNSCKLDVMDNLYNEKLSFRN